MNKICIIEPSSAGLELLPAAKTMKLNVLVFSANKDERIIPEDYHSYIDDFIEIDTYDVSSLHKELIQIHSLSPISSIIPGSEYHVPIAALLSDKMKLPGISPRDVDGLRIKHKMREQLQKNAVRCPCFQVIKTENELLAAKQNIKFPCVIKPVASAGSVRVTRTNTFTELLNAYQAMCADQWTELGKGIGSIAIIEEYIDGEEYSVEGYVENNTAVTLSITKKLLFAEPYFVEMGHIVPANLTKEKQTMITNYIQEVVTALHVDLGVFHAELRVDDKGPVLMEIAGRLPGDKICDLIKLAKSIDLPKIMIRSHLGETIQIQQKNEQQYAGIRYFPLAKKTKFNEVIGLDQLQKLAGFCEFKLLKQPGENIPPLTDFSGRIAFCIFVAPSYQELESRLQNAAALISFN